MADFDDADPTQEDEFDNEDEEMEDANDGDQDGEADGEQDEDAGGDDDEDDEGEEDDDNGDDEDDDDQPDSSSRRPSGTHTPTGNLAQSSNNPAVVLTAPSPSHRRIPSIVASYAPPTRQEALTAQAYDIVPTMAAPQSTSINAIAATPDMRWVFTGGTDGYVRMYNWIETANGKVPLTVAQKHPFVDSVMKAGSLVTYWENEESTLRTPTRGQEEEGKWTSPVYSLAVQHSALWLLSGTETGSINLVTCRHQAGTRITSMKEHTSAVSVLNLSRDETQLLSGSWDKNIRDWDLQTGKVKRSFLGSEAQVSAIEIRPESSLPVPEVSDLLPELPNGTFSSNNASAPLANGDFMNGFGEDADAAGSPDGSLFGEDGHGSLFGDDGAGDGTTSNMFDEQDDDLARTLASELQDAPGEDADAPGEDVDMEMSGIAAGGPLQPLATNLPAATGLSPTVAEVDGDMTDFNADNIDFNAATVPDAQFGEPNHTSAPLTNGLPHDEDGPLTAPATESSTSANNNLPAAVCAADLPPQSESTFLSTAIDGTVRIWDRRISSPIAIVRPPENVPLWATGACWSPDGNSFYVGRRNNTVDEYSIHRMASVTDNTRSQPNRQFKFQAGSGPVYALRAMPNGRHLVCASNDILRIYDLKHEAGKGMGAVPFTIVPGHRGGVISSVLVDPSCRFMLSAAGNRGWEGLGTEVLLGYEIGVLDAEGNWRK